MKENKPKAACSWGGGAPLAPSIKRVDPVGWAAASALAGLAVCFLVVWVLWRPFPGLPEPHGDLLDHAQMWAKLAARAVLPAMFQDDAKLYGAYWKGLADSGRVAIIWRAACAALAGFAPAALLFRDFMTPRDNLIHVRGALRHEGPAATAALRKKLAQAAKKRPDHDIAPGVPYPSDMWTRHALLVGGTGSGKSTVVKPLIEKVIAARERLILFDPKGEFTSGFGEPAIIAPWDKRSFAWDIAKDMRNVGDMRRFAAAMIEGSQDPMWANASRQILVGFVIYLKRSRGNDWGWRELADLVAMPQASLLAMMSRHHPEAVRAVERASVTTQGILINLSSFCSSIFDLAEAWCEAPESRRISFVEWTLGRGGQTQVILQGHGSYAELSKSYVRGIIEVIASIVNSVEMEDNPSRKLWIIADEFPQMGKVPIRPLFEVGRSRGVRCVLACQDLAQLEEIHGERMVKALVSMSGTLLVGQIMQGETAEQVAKAMGSREVERANVSTAFQGGAEASRSTTLSFARDETPLYKPSELGSRLGPTPDGKGVVMALVTGGGAYELFWPNYEMKPARPSHIPAEWTLGVGLEEWSSDIPAVVASLASAEAAPDGSPSRDGVFPGARKTGMDSNGLPPSDAWMEKGDWDELEDFQELAGLDELSLGQKGDANRAEEFQPKPADENGELMPRRDGAAEPIGADVISQMMRELTDAAAPSATDSKSR